MVTKLAKIVIFHKIFRVLNYKMQKPDIIGAFKVAAQRNQGLDAVKRSLIAAGYDVQDVEDSALAFSQGKKVLIFL